MSEKQWTVELSNGKTVKVRSPSTLYVERCLRESQENGTGPDEWNIQFQKNVRDWYVKNKAAVGMRGAFQMNAFQSRLGYLKSIGWSEENELELHRQYLEEKLERERDEKLRTKEELMRMERKEKARQLKKDRETSKAKLKRDLEAAKKRQRDLARHVETDADCLHDPNDWNMQQVVLWVMQNMERCVLRNDDGEVMGVDFDFKSRKAPASICLRMVEEYSRDSRLFFKEVVPKWIQPKPVEPEIIEVPVEQPEPELAVQPEPDPEPEPPPPPPEPTFESKVLGLIDKLAPFADDEDDDDSGLSIDWPSEPEDE